MGSRPVSSTGQALRGNDAFNSRRAGAATVEIPLSSPDDLWSYALSRAQRVWETPSLVPQ